MKFPQGRYTMVNASVRLSYGGATRSQLLRARLFTQEAHQAVDVITFDVYPEYDEERTLLSQEGLICDGVSLLNLHEDLSAAPNLEFFGNTENVTIPEWYAALEQLPYVVEYSKNGRPWRRKYDPSGSNRSFFFSYLRADGTVYATIDRRIGGTDWDRNERGTVIVSHDGAPIGFYSKKTSLISRWLKYLGRDSENHFLIFDSKESGHLIAEEEREPNQFFIVLAHTPHLQPPRNWDSLPASFEWGETMKGLALWDAFVVLSEAHKTDVKLRYGDRNNLFVIPHPAVDIIEDSEPTQRDPDLALIVCRLEHQKRLEDAIRAFAHVTEKRPSARLEIYGTGTKLQEWTNLVTDLGIAESVKFMGYEPRPERQYARASVFIMTSHFEAQPLALLEALAHGCPIASYDIKYGPAEMVREGQNGHLCPEGSPELLARNILQVLDGDVNKMSASSVSIAHEFSVPVFLNKWAELFTTVLEQKEYRVQALSSSLQLLGMTVDNVTPTGVRMLGGRISFAGTARNLEMKGKLTVVSNRGPAAKNDDLDFNVRLHTQDGQVIFLPTTISELGPEEFIVSWIVEDVMIPQSEHPVPMFYELTWNNEQLLLPIEAEGHESLPMEAAIMTLAGVTA